MNRILKTTMILGIIALVLGGCSASKEWNLPDGLYAEIDTNRGAMVFRLELEKAPMTVANFVGLAEGTVKQTRNSGKFYDGLKFFSKKEELMIIAGDPQGSGLYTPGYTFPDEFGFGLSHKGPGYLSMVSSGPNTNGSQFFITLGEASWLDSRNSLFGEIVEGADVIPKLQVNDEIKTVRILRFGDQYKEYKVSQSMLDNMFKSAWAQVEAAQNSAQADQESIVLGKYPNAKITDSGLRYVIEKEGKGPSADEKGSVIISYSMSLIDGTVLTSADDKGKMKELSFGSMTTGLKEGILMMKKGGKRTIIAPPQLAYGATGLGNIIPENAFIIYEVTLEDVIAD